MERNDIIELGNASIETRGVGTVGSDGILGQHAPGLSND